MTATVRVVRNDLGYGTAMRRIEVVCEHRVTGVSRVGPCDNRADAAAIRLALQTHHAEEGCARVAELWRRYFGCRGPEVRVA